MSKCMMRVVITYSIVHKDVIRNYMYDSESWLSIDNSN